MNQEYFFDKIILKIWNYFYYFCLLLIIYNTLELTVDFVFSSHYGIVSEYSFSEFVHVYMLHNSFSSDHSCRIPKCYETNLSRGIFCDEKYKTIYLSR